MMSSALAAAELRFTVWTGNEAHLTMLNEIAESFKETHPDVTVRYETIPAGDYTQRLTFQLAGGNPPRCRLDDGRRRLHFRQCRRAGRIWRRR